MLWEDEKRMSFTGHLAELRDRLIHSGIFFLVTVVSCYCVSDWLFEIIAKPVRQAGFDVQWVVLSPLEGVITKVKLAAIGGLTLSFPYIIWNICGFIFPGLHDKERKAAQVAIVGCGILSMVGVGVAYFLILPYVMPYISQWVPENVEIQFQLGQTVILIVKALLVFAIVFQFPMVVLVLVYLGILSPNTLREQRRFAIVGLAVAAAMFTPPDPMTMLIMMGPLVLLYEGSIWVSYLITWKKEKQVSNQD